METMSTTVTARTGRPLAAPEGDAKVREARRLSTLLEVSQALSGTLNLKASLHSRAITAPSAASFRSWRRTATFASRRRTASETGPAWSAIASARGSPAKWCRAASRSWCRG